MKVIVLNTTSVTVTDEGDQYAVVVRNINSFVVSKLGYNVTAENLRLALDVIESIEDRR